MNFLRSTWDILKQTVLNFFQDDSFSYASSIAFYTIFSLPAILIISLSVGSTFYERDIVQQELVNQVGRLIGEKSAADVEQILINAALDSTGTVAKIVGIATLIFSATTVFISLQTSLNKIWGIKPKPERGIVKYLLDRLLSLAMVISIGFLLLVSLVFDTVLVVFQNSLTKVLAGWALYLVTAVNIVVSLGIITVIFAILFKVLPDAKIKWKDVWVGAIVTTVFFALGKYLIGFYLGNSSVNSAYGAAGSLVIILIWVYYSTVIFLFGAELTSVYAEKLGSDITPYHHAVKVQVVEVEREPDTGKATVTHQEARHEEPVSVNVKSN
ncbi:MAG TPA: YihY/virulence factor BrkB family protein [Chryseolinea sp.]|jgi:membrane protein|nr:YihY/virulence factor BrkB family protein [Chryseolinea sp.]